jgi:hypothetical protein
MSSLPWRFSFSEIVANPATAFYEMEDVFTGETFLLFSESVSKTLSERPVMLWFNLIGFNGECWQTFGPVTAYQSFNADDIYFFATEVNPTIDSEEDILKNLEDNPIPYMALASGSNYPLIESGGFEVVQLTGESHADKLNVPELKKDFIVEYADGIFKLIHGTWSEYPHFANAYFDEEAGSIFLAALTDTSYRKMVSLVNKYGYDLPIDPDVRVHLTLLDAIKKILNKQLDFNPYNKTFLKKDAEETSLMTERLNEFLLKALPYINEGKIPDIESLARETGIDPEAAREIAEKSMESINKLRS